MRLCFARHGESEANLSRTFSNRDGWHPLTARGVDEAQRLARSLEGERISVLYCSPIARARQTLHQGNRRNQAATTPAAANVEPRARCRYSSGSRRPNWGGLDA